MELPTAREIELETLLRARDKQLAELSDEVAHLRHSISLKPGSPTSDPVTLPPALISVLLPHIHAAASSFSGTTSTSTTVTAALTQRARLLQEENDELYDLLKQGETGKLKEEVRGLRKVVERLEGALRESHQAITALSTELDKTYENLTASIRSSIASNDTKSYSKSPSASYHQMPPSYPTENGITTTKLPPTGPRAHKKLRLSDSQASPHLRTNVPLPPHKTHNYPHNSGREADSREHLPRRLPDARGKLNHSKMGVEEDQRARPPTPHYGRGRERGRERGRNYGGSRERERDGYRPQQPRRNGNFGGGTNRGGSGRKPGRSSVSNESVSGDRTLAERMGL